MIPSDATGLNIFGILFILSAGTLVFALPRRLAFIPIIITACYITYGQQIEILGFNFTILRLVILVAWIRLIARGELRDLRPNYIDKVFICWLVISSVANMLLWQSTEALVNNLGQAYNAVGIYFLFRVLFRNLDEIENFIKISAVIITPLALIMIFEAFSGRNIFSFFGGVPEISRVRNGFVRAQGPFRFSGLAGTVGAVLMPLFVSLWYGERTKLNAVIGFTSATTIVIACHSSGPFLSYCFGILALMMWPLRRNMRIIRYAIVVSVIVLHMVMKAPVWYIIARISSFVGGTGWHRSEIIDAAIRYFNEWWLIGTRDTGHWIPYYFGEGFGSIRYGHTSADITNKYVAEGVNGGLISMLLFIGIIILCFREIGIALQRSENQPFSVQIIIWSLGASLLVHVASFISVTYFDQTIAFWYLSIALISSLVIQKQQTV